MTNAGVRDLVIQKYLRHRSPDMQNYYKHLLKQVLGSEYQELIQEKKNEGKHAAFSFRSISLKWFYGKCSSSKLSCTEFWCQKSGNIFTLVFFSFCIKSLL